MSDRPQSLNYGADARAGLAAALPADDYSASPASQAFPPPLPSGNGSQADAPRLKPVDLGGATSQPAPLLKGQVVRIQEALDETLLNSPRPAAIRATLGIARSQFAAASQSANPALFFDRGLLAEQSRRIGAAQTWDPPWKMVFRLLAAKRQVAQVKLEILQALWSLRADARRTYTELVVAQETADTLGELYDLTRKLHEVAQKRFQAGDVPELDVLKARLATSQAEIDYNQGKRRVVRARELLNIIMGRPVERQVEATRLPGAFQLQAEKSHLLPDFERPLAPLKEFIEKAMADRWELKVTQQTIKTNQALLLNAMGNIVPNPSVAIGQSQAGNPPTGPKLSGWFLSLNIEMPTFNFQQGDITRLRAQINQLRHQLSAQRNVIVAEIASAYNDLVVAREKIRVYQDHVLADSAEVARLARRSYEVGHSDITSTLQAQQANIQIRNQYLDAVREYQQAFTNLEQAVGMPLTY